MVCDLEKKNTKQSLSQKSISHFSPNIKFGRSKELG